MKLITAGYIESISTLKDGSVKFSVSTQEMDGTACAKVFDLRNKFVKILLTDDEIRQMDAESLEKLNLIAPNKKTPSQRLRAVMYRCWEQKGETGDFEQYYLSQMESVIDSYKMELE